MLSTPKIEFRKQVSDLIETLKRDRWLAYGSVNLGQGQSILVYQKPDGAVGQELIRSGSSSVARRKALESIAARTAWTWRKGHPEFLRNPIKASQLRDRMTGPAKVKAKPSPPYELRKS